MLPMCLLLKMMKVVPPQTYILSAHQNDESCSPTNLYYIIFLLFFNINRIREIFMFQNIRRFWFSM